MIICISTDRPSQDERCSGAQGHVHKRGRQKMIYPLVNSYNYGTSPSLVGTVSICDDCHVTGGEWAMIYEQF